MKRKRLKFGKGFHLAIGNPRSQAAQMTLGPETRKVAPTTVIEAAINGCSSLKVPALLS